MTLRALADKVRGAFNSLGHKVLSAAHGIGQKAKTVVQKVVTTAKDVIGDKSIAPRTKSFALFAGAAYGSNAPPPGWTLQSKLSDAKRKVYFQGTNQAVVSFRGTEPSDIHDLADDVLIAQGLQANIPRVKEGIALVDDLATKQGKHVVLTGHSLGGAIAMEVLSGVTDSAAAHVEAWVYNPGVASIIVGGPRYGRSLHIFHVTGDPISAMSRLVRAREKKAFIPLPSLDPHTIRQFTTR